MLAKGKQMQSLPPSHEIDARYATDVFQIMEDCAEDRAEGWTKLGMIVNQATDGPGAFTYISVEWKGKKYDKWFPEASLRALTNILDDWQQELTADGFQNWTSMFFGAVPQADGNIRTIWLPEYAPDGGRWKFVPGVPNWPKVEAELDRLVARAQG